MGVTKNILAATNPVVIILGLPIFVGIVIASATYNIVKNTGTVVSKLVEDFE